MIEEPYDESNTIKYGEIHRLILNSSRRTKGENIDKIEFLNTVDTENVYTLEYLNKLIRLSKAYANKSGIKSESCNFSYHFERNDYIYKGNSLGLAAVCLAYNSILINNINRYYYKFREDCVFTGEIDDNGNLLTLGSDSLSQKIKTVFYSGYKKFIIPEDNLSEAKAELSKLQINFPGRKLELIPCKSFESVFRNLDIVERFELKFHEKLKANYSRYHRIANWAFTVLTFLIIVYFTFAYLMPYLDKNPVRAEFNDSVYSAFNKYDVKVWEYKEPEIKHIDRKSFAEHFFTSIIKISDIDNDGKKEIIANAYFCPFFPDRLVLLNNEGKLLSEYWHSGYLNYISVIDIDKDGKKEILASGINNYPGYRCGCLVVLDPNKIAGASFKTDPLK